MIYLVIIEPKEAKNIGYLDANSEQIW